VGFSLSEPERRTVMRFLTSSGLKWPSMMPPPTSFEFSVGAERTSSLRTMAMRRFTLSPVNLAKPSMFSARTSKPTAGYPYESTVSWMRTIPWPFRPGGMSTAIGAPVRSSKCVGYQRIDGSGPPCSSGTSLNEETSIPGWAVCQVVSFSCSLVMSVFLPEKSRGSAASAKASSPRFSIAARIASVLTTRTSAPAAWSAGCPVVAALQVQQAVLDLRPVADLLLVDAHDAGGGEVLAARDHELLAIGGQRLPERGLDADRAAHVARELEDDAVGELGADHGLLHARRIHAVEQDRDRLVEDVVRVLVGPELAAPARRLEVEAVDETRSALQVEAELEGLLRDHHQSQRSQQQRGR
jgi:hypothetical protein